MKKSKQKWAVHWRADDGDHFMGDTWAVSPKQAINQVHHRQIADEVTIMRRMMVAKLVMVESGVCPACGYLDPQKEQSSHCPNCD